ncbi:MAG: 30S ribosomal protein S24e [Candidatus Thalassarchaeaceae archaeon]|jgi:small subunit ribosomal protein S24e|nr:30S ribosomal protein S24e [Euryarchaeota archaeon]NDB93969.1 30S ribosomal protein S24e [Euryarchaeota archaeon]NDF22378.1 30S ribosomal protein S24e [Euryarchaeota archaeon]NDF36948.1 30S ribosomal protein S24e [Euryarchaeota archaeon]NDG21800.1 30S ribosomal protein S24e [Euryarchaeota archaeon]
MAMEIIERKDNPLLGRVEIKFVWDHSGKGTPTRKEMVIAAAKSEPNADKNLTYIKDVRTVFGKGRTEGYALIYQDEATASIEPGYVAERHKDLFAEPAEGDGE